MQWADFETWGLRLSGVVGALVSMKFVKGTFRERVIMAIGGAAFSFYATDFIVGKLSLPPGLAGFLLGLFGMSILSRLWEWLQTSDVLTWAIDFLTQFKAKK